MRRPVAFSGTGLASWDAPQRSSRGGPSDIHSPGGDAKVSLFIDFAGCATSRDQAPGETPQQPNQPSMVLRILRNATAAELGRGRDPAPRNEPGSERS